MRNTILYMILVLSFACKSKTDVQNNNGGDKKEIDEITVTPNQAKLAEIETGKMEKKVLSDYIECTGTIEAPSQSMVTVTAPMGGIIRENKLLPGIFVSKGTVLAVLENAEYTKLQQEYLQAGSQLDFYKEEYKRQGELTLENAASLKKMQMSQSEYKSIEAKYNALKKQLQLIGINPETLTADNITSTITILAPISGHITRVEGNSGKYIPPFECVCELIDKSHLHLSLSVFEKDILKVKKDQRVAFSVVANPGKEFEATVEIIGQAITEESKGVPVHAHIEGNSSDFFPGMYVNAKIFLTNNQVYSLPHTAIVKHGNNAVIYLKHGNVFKRKPVKVGVELNNNVEIKNPDTETIQSEIVTEGAYYIESEWGKNSK